jgi:nucleoside-diphosphate-sugar epimerase
MRIFLAGASGAIGKRLVPALVAGGHEVFATTRTPDKTDALRAEGATPVLMDGLNKDSVMSAVTSSRPDAIVHQMTALTSMRSLKKWDDEFAVTNRLRTEGTEYLLAAGRAAGTRKYIAQSYAGWPSGGGTEDAPLDAQLPPTMTRTRDAIQRCESLVTAAASTAGVTGIALRYGSFYGPGTSLSYGGELVELIRQRKFPLVGDGAGVWSFIHMDDAAVATRLAIERGTSGIYNIVDDEPAAVAEWLPELARAVGAKPPRRVPVWLARFIIGDSGVFLMTRVPGASNAKAKRDWDWQLAYPSWREGFRRGLSAQPAKVSYPKAV